MVRRFGFAWGIGLALVAGLFAPSAMASPQPLDFTPLQPLLYLALGIAGGIGLFRIARFLHASGWWSRRVTQLVVILLLAGAAAGLARAQDSGGGTVVDISELLGTAIQLAAVLLLGVLSWGGRWIVTNLKLQGDEKIRQYLESAIFNAVEFARDAALGASKDISQVNVRSEVVASAVGYLLPKVPDALRHFGITERGLADMVRARLPQLDSPPLGTPLAGAGS